MIYVLFACSSTPENPPTVAQDNVQVAPEKVMEVVDVDKKVITNISTGLENERWKIVATSQKIEVINKQNQKKRTIYEFTSNSEEGTECEEEGTATPLSLVGNFFSWQESGGGYCEGAAHPYTYQEWYTIDLHKPLQKDEYGLRSTMDIRELLSEEDLLNALIQDKVVQKYWGKREYPNTLSGLLDNIDGDCDIRFSDLPKDFSFHHIQQQKDGSYNVAVRFGLPYGCEANRGNFTELGMYFSIPTQYVSDFVYADTHQQLGKYLHK